MRKKNIRALVLVAAVALAVTAGLIIAISRLAGRSADNRPAPQPQQTGDAAPSGTIQFGGGELPVVGEVPRTTHDPVLFETENGRMRYNDPAVQTFTGIDVSAHREEIDWQAVKADGIDFAMIRVGWRGNTEGHLYQDEYFEQNARDARAAGLEIGVYLYSQAVTVEEAAEEAQAVIGWIADYEITYPVVFDWEYVSSDARTGSMDSETLNACALAFCERIEAAGYIPMIYFNLDTGYRRYDLAQIAGYDFWLAEYDGAPTFYYDYQMLQYTCYGSVAGSDDWVDLNLSFVDYAAKTRAMRRS